MRFATGLSSCGAPYRFHFGAATWRNRIGSELSSERGKSSAIREGVLMQLTPGVRRSLTDIQAEYESGEKEALETLMRAWKGIKDLPPTDPRSFFMLGGYHGEPFRDQGSTDPAWWGGYCEHATVLFPTWHRAYLYTLEKALQSIPGCDTVIIPFWDETSPESLAKGLPGALTWETFELDGQVIPNPLRSFVLPVAIVDAVKGDDPPYSKPAGYETVRYPLSGLVGTDAERSATAAHNAKFPAYDTNVELLNQNIASWLNAATVVDGKPIGGFVHQKFVRCLEAPSYTLFSNTTSAAAYNAPTPPTSRWSRWRARTTASTSRSAGSTSRVKATSRRSMVRTGTWARMTQRALTRSSTSTTALSTTPSGRGSAGTRAHKRLRSTRAIPVRGTQHLLLPPAGSRMSGSTSTAR